MDTVFEKIKEIFDDRKKRGIIIASASAALLIAIVLGCGIYLNDYYRADYEAVAEAVAEATDVRISEPYEKITVFSPAYESEIGFIFYPGGKVEAKAYEPLMAALASRGIVAVLCEMPFNLAVLDVGAAEGIPEMLPEVKNWYIGGHSLGGSMAASYLADNTDKLDGIVLLGSYSTADLRGSRVLSVYGSEDGVMNREKYGQYRPICPRTLPSL